jgi:G:T/U-mismatch repair DNA glycosylase
MISSFPHFINSQTETLILGTIPGVASLMKQEYYAQRNHFGKLCIPFLAVCLSQKFILKNKTLTRE